MISNKWLVIFQLARVFGLLFELIGSLNGNSAWVDRELSVSRIREVNSTRVDVTDIEWDIRFERVHLLAFVLFVRGWFVACGFVAFVALFHRRYAVAWTAIAIVPMLVFVIPTGYIVPNMMRGSFVRIVAGNSTYMIFQDAVRHINTGLEWLVTKSGWTITAAIKIFVGYVMIPKIAGVMSCYSGLIGAANYIDVLNCKNDVSKYRRILPAPVSHAASIFVHVVAVVAFGVAAQVSGQNVVILGSVGCILAFVGGHTKLGQRNPAVGRVMQIVGWAIAAAVAVGIVVILEIIIDHLGVTGLPVTSWVVNLVITSVFARAIAVRAFAEMFGRDISDDGKKTQPCDLNSAGVELSGSFNALEETELLITGNEIELVVDSAGDTLGGADSAQNIEIKF